MRRSKKIRQGLGLAFYNTFEECQRETKKEKIKKLKDERNTYMQRIQNIDREIEKLCNETGTD